MVLALQRSGPELLAATVKPRCRGVGMKTITKRGAYPTTTSWEAKRRSCGARVGCRCPWRYPWGCYRLATGQSTNGALPPLDCQLSWLPMASKEFSSSRESSSAPCPWHPQDSAALESVRHLGPGYYEAEQAWLAAQPLPRAADFARGVGHQLVRPVGRTWCSCTRVWDMGPGGC